jgi:hypothetical protein
MPVLWTTRTTPQFRRLSRHCGGTPPRPESPVRQVHNGVTAARVLPKADMRRSTGHPASPRCCSLHQPQQTCQRERIHRDL